MIDVRPYCQRLKEPDVSRFHYTDSLVQYNPLKGHQMCEMSNKLIWGVEISVSRKLKIIVMPRNDQ